MNHLWRLSAAWIYHYPHRNYQDEGNIGKRLLASQEEVGIVCWMMSKRLIIHVMINCSWWAEALWRDGHLCFICCAIAFPFPIINQPLFTADTPIFGLYSCMYDIKWTISCRIITAVWETSKKRQSRCFASTSSSSSSPETISITSGR